MRTEAKKKGQFFLLLVWEKSAVWMWLSAVMMAVAPFAQANYWQRSSIERARRFMNAQNTTMAALYVAEDEFEEELHKRKLALSRELHLAEMVHDVGIAQREAVRDDWAQHSQYLQSVMMVASLIFALSTSLFCEASIPFDVSSDSNNITGGEVINFSSVNNDAPAGSYAIVAVFFSLLCAIGVSSSLATLWLGLKVQARMAEFDFHAPAAIYSCHKTHFEFSDYHACHCQDIEWFSYVLFLVSVVSTIAGGCLSYSAAMFDVMSAVSSTAVAGCAAAFSLCAVLAVALGAVHSFVEHRR